MAFFSSYHTCQDYAEVSLLKSPVKNSTIDVHTINPVYPVLEFRAKKSRNHYTLFLTFVNESFHGKVYMRNQQAVFFVLPGKCNTLYEIQLSQHFDTRQKGKFCLKSKTAIQPAVSILII